MKRNANTAQHNLRRNLSKIAKNLLREIASGNNRVFYFCELPYGWRELEAAGLAVRDGKTKAKLTEAGAVMVSELNDATHRR